MHGENFDETADVLMERSFSIFYKDRKQTIEVNHDADFLLVLNENDYLL
jgi:hypothetical protein